MPSSCSSVRERHNRERMELVTLSLRKVLQQNIPEEMIFTLLDVLSSEEEDKDS